MKADLTAGIALDVGAAYGRSEQTQTQTGYVINTRIQQALNATNTTTCTVNSNGCVPLNLFGQDGSISPAQVAYLQGQSTIRINTDLTQVHALFSGDITQFGSASQPVSFAVGGEYRKYEYERIPDAFAADPSALGGAGGAVLPFTGGLRRQGSLWRVDCPAHQRSAVLQRPDRRGRHSVTRATVSMQRAARRSTRPPTRAV